MASDKMLKDLVTGINNQIDEVEKRVKDNAENTLSYMIENYRQFVLRRAEDEERKATSERSKNNFSESEVHKLRATIYRSILEINMHKQKMALITIGLFCSLAVIADYNSDIFFRHDNIL